MNSSDGRESATTGAGDELERLRRMFQQAPGAMAILRGPTHIFEMVNPAYLQLIGHRQVVGKPVAEALPEISAQGFTELLGTVYRSGEAYVGKAVDVMLQRLPGGELEHRVVDFVYQPLKDAAGQVTGIFVEATDVTDRVRAEQALRRSETRFRQLVESSPVGVAISEPEGGVPLANDALLAMLGRTRADVEKEPLDWHRFTPPEYLHLDAAHMEALRRGELPPPFEKELIRADGSRFTALIVARFLPGEGERMVAFAMDVTERKRAEEQLRKTEQRLSRLFETNLLGVIYFDINGSIMDANDEFLRIVGYDRTDLKAGRIDWSHMTPEEFRAQDERAVAELRSIGAHTPIEKHYLRKDGSPVWVLVGSAMIDGDSGVGFVLDLSDLKAAAEALRQADRRKDEFLATLAHELRNPLAPIRNAVEILKLSHSQNPLVHTASEIIARQVHHMVRLVDDLLDVSRITLGQVNLRREIVSLGAVLTDAVEVARPAIEAAEHSLTVHMPPESMQLQGDATRLSQVFQNILNNAAKYTPKGGHITLRVEHVGADARIHIRDTGLGIPKEMQPRIFELFTRAHPAEEMKTSGLGIGLALARQLVELHGGRIEVRSEGVGAGSEFIVTLPLLSSQHAAAVAASASATGLGKGKRRVLIVDDNRDAAESLAMLLDLSGCETEAVFDGATALERVETFQPEIALLDIGMPGMDGYETARRMRSSASAQKILIVALSGWGQKEDKARALAAGFDEHLTKPVDPGVLGALLRLKQATVE